MRKHSVEIEQSYSPSTGLDMFRASCEEEGCPFITKWVTDRDYAVAEAQEHKAQTAQNN
jgi:hypothetical protein